MEKEKGKKKKRFLRKRNVIFAIILLIVVSLTANFFVSCGKDEFETTPDVETITNQASTMLKPPTDGSVPTDYDAKTNVYYAIYAMNSLNSFTTESYGETVTKVALVSVSQKIKGSRVVNNGEVYKENVSHSSFKSVGSRTFVKGENYVVHNANNVSSIEEVAWEQTANRISKDSYLESFGYVPNSITGYLLTDETILSAEFLGEENGIYSFYYDLDTEKSTGRLSLEMRTMAGSTSMPLFDKASITVRMNKDWQVTEVVTSSIYSVNLLGGVTCTESVTEKFSNYNQGVQVPNVEFYNSYLDAEITEPAPETLTATDYLMAGFADYVNGSKPLKINGAISSSTLSANLDALVSISLEDLASTSLSLNLKELKYQDVSVKDVFVAFENPNLYIKAGEFKAVTTIEELSGAFSNLSSTFGIDLASKIPSIDLSGLDLTSLISGATLTETDALATVSLPLTFGDVSINANIVLSKGENVSVKEITASIGELNVKLTINDEIVLPEKGEGYNAITPLLSALSENVKAQIELGDASLFVNLNLKTFELDAFINELSLGDFDLKDVKVKLLDNVIYANVNGVKAKLNLSSVNSILDKLSFLPINIELPDLGSITNIDASTIIVGALNTLSTTSEQDGLSITANVLGYDLRLLLSVTNGEYSLGGISIELNGTKVNANLYNGDVPSIAKEDLANYNDIATLLDIIENNEVNLSVKAFDLDIDLSVNLTDFTILAKTQLFGETLYAKLSGNKIYISYKGLNAYVDLADVSSVLDKLGIFVGDIELPDFSNITIESIISSLTITETDVITIATEINGIDIAIVLDKTNGLKVNSVSAKVEDIEITATPSVKADYSGMSNGNYYNLVTLLDVIDENGKINVTANAFNLDVYATIDLVNGEIFVKVDDFEILVSIEENVIYARYPGAIAKLDISDINFILNELKPLITRFITEEEFNSIDVDALKNISIEDIISSISVTEYESIINVKVALSCAVADITLDKGQNGLIVSGGTIKMDVIEIPFTLTNEVLSLTFDKTLEYIDLTSVVETLAPALRNILTLDNLYANMTATLTTGNKIYDLTKCEVLITNIYSTPRARVSLALTISTVNPDGTITEDSRHEIELYYLDPSLVAEGAINTYFTYNDMTNAEDVFAGSFTTVNFYETLDIIKQIYGNMPELRDALKPFIVPDEKGMPKFMELDVKFNELINSALFTNDVFAVDVNGKAVLNELNSSILVNLFSENGLLCLDVDGLKFNDTSIVLDARVGEAPSGVITEDKFSFTPADNTQDFSSINELLKALEKTSQKRSFYIDGKIDMLGTKGTLASLLGNLAKDKVDVDVYLDVIGAKTYFKAILTRKYIVGIWSDYEGTSNIYFDPDEQMIYIHNEYYKKKTVFFVEIKGSKAHEYLKYTVEEFSADPMGIIFNAIHLSDSLVKTITDSSNKEKVSTATIENTLKTYTYNGTDTFNIVLDLAPLTTDIKLANVTIIHDNNYNLSELSASVNMLDMLDLNLYAKLFTSETSYGTDIEAKAQASNSNYN